MRSLHHFLFIFWQTWSQRFIFVLWQHSGNLESGCCYLQIEYYVVIITMHTSRASAMKRTNRPAIGTKCKGWDAWLHVCTWSTPAQSLFTGNSVLCNAGREKNNWYCYAATKHVRPDHLCIRAPTVTDRPSTREIEDNIFNIWCHI